MNYSLKFSPIGIIALIFLLGACTGSLSSTNIKGPSTYKQRMDLVTGGYQRSYRVHIPSGYDGLTSLPLVVVIHGAFDTARGIEKISGFSQIADRETFIVLYPEGIGILGYLQHWNAGHCCGKAANERIDDVGYLVEAIEDVCMRLTVDRSRVYMVGFSNGGMMTYRFAAEHPDKLAAAAAIAASIGGRSNAAAPLWRIQKPDKKLPIFIMHGLNDDDIPFSGGRSMVRKGDRSYLSVRDSVQFWIDANGCNGPPVISDLCGGCVQIQTWHDNTKASETVLCVIKNWGHIWPGPYFTGKLADNNALYGFNAAELIWSFFKKFPCT